MKDIFDAASKAELREIAPLLDSVGEHGIAQDARELGGFGLRSQGRVGSTPTAPQPPATPSQLRALIKAYYAKPGNLAGGTLHVTLDDGNIETHHILFCLGQAKDARDVDGVRIAELLLSMTRRQRAKAVGW